MNVEKEKILRLMVEDLKNLPKSFFKIEESWDYAFKDIEIRLGRKLTISEIVSTKEFVRQNWDRVLESEGSVIHQMLRIWESAYQLIQSHDINKYTVSEPPNRTGDDSKDCN